MQFTRLNNEQREHFYDVTTRVCIHCLRKALLEYDVWNQFRKDYCRYHDIYPQHIKSYMYSNTRKLIISCVGNFKDISIYDACKYLYSLYYKWDFTFPFDKRTDPGIINSLQRFNLLYEQFYNSYGVRALYGFE